jgi:4-amino-4-deoxy-L-arabinose transferase-like glycosyltransferase
VLFRAASSAYGSIAGCIALSAFGLNLLSPRLATLVRTDMPLALVIFLIGVRIWQKIQTQQEWKSRDRIYIFALLTIAMLIKGPIVYAFLLPGILLFEWWRRRHALGHGEVVAGVADPGRRSFQTSTSAWPGWWPWIGSLAVFLLWVSGGILFQSGFFEEVVMREFLARFGETIHRPQPLYFYLPHLLHKFAPWSLLIIAIVILELASRRWKIGAAFREMQPAVLWLLCWSLGGLLVMSLVPSKRVDRIFPVIPPLCLLLASQINGRIGALRGSDTLARRPYLLIAIVFAIFFTGGYTTWKVIRGYRDHRHALAIFGRDVRREAEARHWRYEVVSARDEGLLLYLQKTHFTEPDNAIADWNSGNLDALVASTEKVRGLMPQLRGATISQLRSTEKKKGQGTGYVLMTR